MITYNLGNLWRRLALPQRIQDWSLTSLQQRLVKTGGWLVKHARYYWPAGREPPDAAALRGDVRRMAALRANMAQRRPVAVEKPIQRPRDTAESEKSCRKALGSVFSGGLQSQWELLGQSGHEQIRRGDAVADE